MSIERILQFNDWGIKKFFIILFSLLTVLWVSILLGMIGINIPFLRESVGLIVILYFPGALILRILKIQENDLNKNLLYCVGLSISTISFIGFFVSYFYPLVGIVKPLSLIPLLSTITLVLLLFSIISYIRDKGFSNINFKLFNFEKKAIVASLFSLVNYVRDNVYSIINFKLFNFDKKVLCLMLIPFISIFGSYLITFYNIYWLTMIMIILLGVIILLASFGKIPVKLYPLTIFVISISLLFQNSLISTYISGFDVQSEIYVTKMVISNLKWNPFSLASSSTPTTAGVFFNYAYSLTSVTVLPAIIQIITEIDVIYIYKIIYPLIFSLVPLGLYSLFKREFNYKTSFLAVIFFMSVYAYYFNMLSLMREIIGEVFFILIILLLLDKKLLNAPKSILLVIFTVCFITSHYGLAYLFLPSLIFVTIYMYLFDKKSLKKSNLSINFLLLYTVLISFWYLFTSNSVIFILIVNIIHNIASTITTEFLNPTASQGLGIILSHNYLINNLNKYLNIITQIFIAIGIGSLILNKYITRINEDVIKDSITKINKVFLLFAIVSFFICIASIILPNFSVALDTVRIYQFTLFFLAPLGIIGGILILNLVTKNNDKSVKLLSIFLVIFLFFNTGLVNEITKVPYGPTIAFNNINDPPLFTESEVNAAQWLDTYKINNSMVYSDSNGFDLLNGFIGDRSTQIYYSIPSNTFNTFKPNSYIFLREKNVQGMLDVPILDQEGLYVNNSFIATSQLNTSGENEIYDNNAVILYQ